MIRTYQPRSASVPRARLPQENVHRCGLGSFARRRAKGRKELSA